MAALLRRTQSGLWTVVQAFIWRRSSAGKKRLYYGTVYPSTCNLNMNSALTLWTNAVVCYNILKVTKLQCFRFSYNEAHSLLTFGIQLFNSDAAMNSLIENVCHAPLTIFYWRDSTISCKIWKWEQAKTPFRWFIFYKLACFRKHFHGWATIYPGIFLGRALFNN